MKPTVYFLKANQSGRIKIGWTADLATRLSNLRGGSPEELGLLATIPGGEVLEAHLHETFADERIHGEWFTSSERLSSFISDLSRPGFSFMATGFSADDQPAPFASRFSEAAVTESARVCGVRCVTSLEARGFSRMEAYAHIARDIGVSQTWVRRLIGRQSNFVLHAHVFLGLQGLADELERSPFSAPLLRSLRALNYSQDAASTGAGGPALPPALGPDAPAPDAPGPSVLGLTPIAPR